MLFHSFHSCWQLQLIPAISVPVHHWATYRDNCLYCPHILTYVYSRENNVILLFMDFVRKTNVDREKL